MPRSSDTESFHKVSGKSLPKFSLLTSSHLPSAPTGIFNRAEVLGLSLVKVQHDGNFVYDSEKLDAIAYDKIHGQTTTLIKFNISKSMLADSKKKEEQLKDTRKDSKSHQIREIEEWCSGSSSERMGDYKASEK